MSKIRILHLTCTSFTQNSKNEIASLWLLFLKLKLGGSENTRENLVRRWVEHKLSGSTYNYNVQLCTRHVGRGN